jgi:hypothetical protein
MWISLKLLATNPFFSTADVKVLSIQIKRSSSILTARVDKVLL